MARLWASGAGIKLRIEAGFAALLGRPAVASAVRLAAILLTSRFAAGERDPCHCRPYQAELAIPGDEPWMKAACPRWPSEWNRSPGIRAASSFSRSRVGSRPPEPRY